MTPIEVLNVIRYEVSAAHKNTNQASQPSLNAFWQKLNTLQINSQIVISHLQYDGVEPLDEYVELCNKSDLVVDLSGWQLEAGLPDQLFVFPEGYLMHPQQTVRVYTDSSSELSFHSKKPIWNNSGDCGLLKTPDGELVCQWAYRNNAHADVSISHIHVDGKEHRSEGDEFVELTNMGLSHLDISHWTLVAQRNHTSFEFPSKTVLGPHQTFRVYTNKADCGEGQYSINSRAAIWNNQGGACLLCDDTGREVSTYKY
ncbi:lamin tail domain-containing protein [Marinomonas transparens]|nr:lamin tail domain-containing protein [Marinomonas transparens]